MGLFHTTMLEEEGDGICQCCSNPGNIHGKCVHKIWIDQDLANDPYLYMQAIENSSRGTLKTLNYELHFTAANNYIRRLNIILGIISNSKIPISSLLDSDGGTVLHTALKRNQTEAAKMLIHTGGPSLVLQPYKNKERKLLCTSCLHFAVVNGNRELVHQMMGLLNVEERKFLLDIQADGYVFKNKMRCSGLPLSLSTWCGIPELFEDLVNYGADLDSRDNITGNTIMHTLIENGAKDPETAKKMMDVTMNSNAALEWWSKKRGFSVNDCNQSEKARFHRYILNLRNFDGYTPLTLAAKLGTAPMLVHTLGKEGVYKFTSWIYGRYSVANYDMSEVDPLVVGRTKPSVIELLVFSAPDTGLPAFACPAISQLIDAKWNHTWLMFLIWFIYHCVVMSIMTAVAVNSPSERNATNVTNLYANSHGTKLVGEVLVVLTAVIYLLSEIMRIGLLLQRLYTHCSHKKGKKSFVSPITLILRPEAFRLIALLFSLCVICRTFMQFMMISYIDIPSSIALVTGWYFVLYFTRAFESASFFTLMIHKMLLGDMLRFGIAFLVLLIGFGTSMRVLYMETTKEMPHQFSSFGASLLSMFRLLTGLDDLNYLDQSRSPEAATFLYLVFICIASILLLNMLIAAMSDTYANVAQNSHTLFLKSRLLSIIHCEECFPCIFRTKRLLRRYMIYRIHENRWELPVESM